MIDFDILKERIEKRIKETENNNQRKDDNVETLVNRIECLKNQLYQLLIIMKKRNFK